MCVLYTVSQNLYPVVTKLVYFVTKLVCFSKTTIGCVYGPVGNRAVPGGRVAFLEEQKGGTGPVKMVFEKFI